MGYWDYKHIGASANRENKKHVEKIFDYIGYGRELDYSDGEECSFREPEVYRCVASDNPSVDSEIDIKPTFRYFSETDLLNLLNALFPKTNVYVHSAEGNNTSDTWENHDKVYDASSMTLECKDSYTDYGGDGSNGSRSWKEKFTLQVPQQEYIEELINLSTLDGNAKLTALLEELLQKLKEGRIIFENDSSDTRVIGEKYDIEEEGYLDDPEDEDSVNLDGIIEEGRFWIKQYNFIFDRTEFEKMKESIIAWAQNNEYDLDIKMEDKFEEFFRKLGFDQSFFTEPDYPGDVLISASGDYVDVMNDLSYPFLDLLNMLSPYLKNREDVDICLLEPDEDSNKVRIFNLEDGTLNYYDSEII